MQYQVWLFLFATALLGCNKEVPANIQTRVSGTILEEDRQLPVPNATVYIYEYGKTLGFSNARERKTVDSVKTGAAGNYAISFVTTGKGFGYGVGFDAGSNFYKDPNASYEGVKITAGHDTLVDFQVQKLSILKTHILITDNPYPPLYIQGISGSRTVAIAANDTVVYLPVFQNRNVVLQLSIWVPDTTQTPSTGQHKIKTETIPLTGYADTFETTLKVFPRLF